MGQAKQRGALDLRVAEAKARINALQPETIFCNQCGGSCLAVKPIDAAGLPGVKAAFAALCPACRETSVAFVGDAVAVRAAMDAFQQALGVPLNVAVIPSNGLRET